MHRYAWFWVIVQRHSNKNWLVLAQKQIHWSVDSTWWAPCSHNPLIFDKVSKNTFLRKDSIFNKEFYINRVATCGRINLDLFLQFCIKVNSKRTEDFNTKPEAHQLLEEKRRVIFLDRNTGNDFLSNLQSLGWWDQ